MSTLASVVVQDLTYTEAQLGAGVTISYTNGGTAGSEVVSVSGHDITIQIQTGVSTATQIRTAFNASAAATALATCTVSGTGSNAQKTVKNAFLLGGAAAAKASLTVGGVMTLTADTAGTAGNSIRFKFTAGATAGSEAVTVSTNDITVQIADGVSTYAQVKAALDADTGAAALVDVASAGPSLTGTALVSACSAFTNLSGGVAAAAATKVLQDLTFTAPATGTAGNAVSLTYTTGATAGSEVVSVSGNAITVQIENGVSTATQIRTAYNAVGAATALATCTVSGTGSNAQKTVNAASMTGAVGTGPDAFYADQNTALTSSFVLQSIHFPVKVLTVYNDETSGTKTVIGSYDGTNTAFTLTFGQSLTVRDFGTQKLWLKYGVGAPSYRVSAI